jgi:hypothetical protein
MRVNLVGMRNAILEWLKAYYELIKTPQQSDVGLRRCMVD